MAQGSAIEWTEATWNPVAGCTAVSPGCKNCYAARMALRLEHMGNGGFRKYAGTAARSSGGQPYFTGKINLDPDSLDLPRRWRKPRTIFVNSMSDLFHDAVPLQYIKRVFAVMEECARHQFQVLTKRPERALELAPSLPWPANVWLGTSVESAVYFERIRTLRRVPAKIRFLSLEPLLGPLARSACQSSKSINPGQFLMFSYARVTPKAGLFTPITSAKIMKTPGRYSYDVPMER